MRAVVQRVSSARVEVRGRVAGEIRIGLAVLAAVERGDGEREVRWMAEKLAHLRVFADGEGKLNRSVMDVGGEILLVSNFTVAGRLGKGRRPTFEAAMGGEEARAMFERLVEAMLGQGMRVACGEFGADMSVVVVNDGPVTIVLETAAVG